jgi:flagellar P-ring protein precursor FlgI
MSTSVFIRRSVLALAVASFVTTLVPGVAAQSTDVSRLKDVVSLQGFRPMPLVGYGLVVGLNKTGDKRQTIFSTQSLANMLSRFGVVVAPDQMKVENSAAVVVTWELSP